MFFLLSSVVSSASAEDRVTFSMRTNRLHEIIVSLCDPHPPIFQGCTTASDTDRAQEIADRLVTLISFGHYQSLAEAGVTMQLQPEHEGVY
jgi:hypothetical protein